MKKIYLLIILAVFSLGCQREEFIQPDEIRTDHLETVSPHEVREVLNNLTQSSKNYSKSQLNDYLAQIGDSIYFDNIRNSNALLGVVPAITVHNNHNSRILFLKINGEMRSVVFSTTPNMASSKDIYTGEILLTDLEGNFLDGYRIRNNAIVSRYVTGSSAKATQKTLSETDGSCSCPFSVCEWCELDEVIVEGKAPSPPTPYISISYIYGYEGGGDNTGDFDEAYYDYCGGGCGASDAGTTPTEEEDKIDDSQLTGKEKCLNELLNKKGDSYVKNLLSNFQGDDSEFDISISSVDQIIRDDISKTGLTQKPINGVINILISSSEASSRPALGVARTLLHEYIHADMFRKLNTKYSTSEDLDFKNTYESFKNGNFKASPQHETMAELYIHEMTSSLQAFHRNVLTGDYMYLTDNGMNPLPTSFYEALAWQGLKEAGVAAYNELSPEKKTELQNALEMYYSTTTTSCPNP